MRRINQKDLNLGSHYDSPLLMIRDGEPELELTTLSGELVLELTTPAGFTAKLLKEDSKNFFPPKIRNFLFKI